MDYSLNVFRPKWTGFQRIPRGFDRRPEGGGGGISHIPLLFTCVVGHPRPAAFGAESVLQTICVAVRDGPAFFLSRVSLYLSVRPIDIGAVARISCVDVPFWVLFSWGFGASRSE